MMLSRREFLKRGTYTGLALTLGRPAILSVVEAITDPALVTASATPSDKVVAVVNLFGGNDGLNTVIPLAQFDRYRTLRPTIALPSESILSLSDTSEFGLNPGMTALRDLYSQGQVAIINGVGVPTGTDGLFDHSAQQSVFQTCTLDGSGSASTATTGWLGRYLDTVPVGSVSTGIDLGGGRRMLTGLTTTPLSLDGIEGLLVSSSGDDADAKRSAYQTIVQIPHTASAVGEDVRQIRLQMLAQGEILRQATANYQPLATYPDSWLGFQLLECAKLIAADLGIRAFAVGTGGFDTHSDQREGGSSLGFHDTLLKDLGDSISAFYTDLVAHGVADRVVILTISEFGRRAYQNDDGTDHGLGSISFAIGSLVRGGIYGTYPSLNESALVYNGNLEVTTDFRSVYATILANVFQVNPTPIIGASVPLLGFL